MSSNSHLASIIANTQWLEALTRWYQAGGCPCNLGCPSLSLSLESWQALQALLLQTKWFERNDGTITTTTTGQDFLARASELFRAMRREGKQDRKIVELLDTLPRGGAVDIGCGPGYSSLQLVRLGFAPVHSFDLSRTALEIAKAILNKEAESVFLHDRDATRLSGIESGSVALIYSRTALQYFKQAELAATLNRTLRHGGYVVAEVAGLSYYVQGKHFRKLLRREKRLQPFSYWRTVLRTIIYETLTLQPRLAAGAPEIGFTKRSIRRLASWSGLEVVSVTQAPSLVGYLIVMRKPV